MFVYLSISQSVNPFFSACLSDSMSFKLTRLRAIGLVLLLLTEGILSHIHFLTFVTSKCPTQSVYIRPWKTISQHNIASGRNMKKSKYYVWTKYFDWKQTLLGSNISSGHNLQHCALTKYFPWTKLE